MEIKDDLLVGAEVEFIKSPNYSGKFKAGQPDTAVIHYTAAPSVISAVRTLTNPRVKASAHLIVGRDGSVKQLIPFNVIAWHAGKSSYQGRDGLNSYSIGIEIDNAGPLTKSGSTFRDVYGNEYQPNQVVEGIHRNQTTPKFWHAYTEVQIEKVIDILELLIQTYKVKLIVGHEEIAPNRKTDPGPAFPLDKIRSELLGSDRDKDGADDVPDSGRVSASKLNIRATGEDKGKLVAMPLPKGSKVTILEQKGDWYRVKTEIEGWVSAKYVDTTD
ncbi:MAG: hypothetical protein RIS47_1633 [Bacteroidota bacterium]|jgi:N-acetylmuramoyl-L-alanine amidase